MPNTTHVLVRLIEDNQTACTLIQDSIKDLVKNHLTESDGVQSRLVTYPVNLPFPDMLTLSLPLAQAVALAWQRGSSPLDCRVQ